MKNKVCELNNCKICIKFKWDKRTYMLNFVEEGIYNPDYYGYRGGRVEIIDKDHQYQIAEYRFLTNKVDEFSKFRDEFDFEWITLKELKKFKKVLELEYHEKVK